MVSAVNLSSVSGITASTSSGPSKAKLEAQIADYQKQLSECVACPSSKTPEGKANIESLSNKLNSAQARLKEMTDTPSISSSSQSTTPPSQNTQSTQLNSTNSNASTSNTPDSTQINTVGSLINIYA